MISKPYRLEEFDLECHPTTEAAPPNSVLENEKLAAFEQGYRAGWDDATAAQYQDQSRITTELENSFRDLSFTFNEARSHIIQKIEPLMKEIVNKVIPDLAFESLPELISERVLYACKDTIDKPISISVSPESRQAVEAAIPKDPGFPILLKEEPALGPGQAFINLGATEEVLDLDETLNSIKLEISEFFESNKMVKSHG